MISLDKFPAALQEKWKKIEEDHWKQKNTHNDPGNPCPKVVTTFEGEFDIDSDPRVKCSATLQMLWFALFDHESPRPWEKSIIRFAVCKLEPSDKRVVEILLKTFNDLDFDDVIIDKRHYYRNSTLMFSKNPKIYHTDDYKKHEDPYSD